MKRAEAILRKILFPGPLLSLLSVPLAAVLLCCAFFLFEEESPLTYLAYLFSAYSLIIVCTAAVTLIQKIRRGILDNRYARRYLKDHSFKCGSRCIFRFASICYMPG